MTMKANELMIGDLVTFKDCINDEEILVIKIWRLSQEGNALVFIDDSNVLDEIAIDDEIVGIPLTPKILEKNGFHINGIPSIITSVKCIDDWSDDDWSDDTYVWSRQETPDERMFVSVYIDDPANFFVEVYCQYCHVDGIHVKYLHQLQHTLKLCGIDKEIVL